MVQAKVQLRERKGAMKKALNVQERQDYDRKHIDNQARKQEMLASLF